MARIVYDPETIGGLMVAEAIQHVVEAQTLLNRAKALMDAIAGGGSTPVNLESSSEFGVAAGSGSDFYTAINGMKTNIASITVVAIASVDMGG